MSDALVGLGHNQPPSPILPADDIPASLARNHAGLLRRKDELLAAVEAFLTRYPVIETREVAAAAAENLQMLSNGVKRFNASRVIDKDPYLEGGRAIDAWFKSSTDALQAAWNKLNKPNAAYLAAVEKRNREIANANALRLAEQANLAAAAARAGNGHISYDEAIEAATVAEDATRLAEASVTEHSRMTGSYGTAVTLSRTWDHEITDPDAVPRHLCSPDPRLIRAEIKNGLRVATGLRIFPVDKTRTR